MNNPIDYLWYKIYRWLKFVDNGGNAIQDTACIGMLFFANVISVMMLVFGYFPNTYMFILIFIVSEIITLPYTKRKNKMKIIRKYIRESDKSRIKGNAIVIVYTIMSFAICFLVLAYHISISNLF